MTEHEPKREGGGRLYEAGGDALVGWRHATGARARGGRLRREPGDGACLERKTDGGHPAMGPHP